MKLELGFSVETSDMVICLPAKDTKVVEIISVGGGEYRTRKSDNDLETQLNNYFDLPSEPIVHHL